MKLTDLLPMERWVALENEINRRWGLDANVFDTTGHRISDVKNWANRLCPAIKATDRGQSFICAVAHMNLSAISKRTGKPVIEECDAGLLKMVVPIVVAGEFLGAVGACGHLLDDGEVDDFMINRTTEIDTETIESFSTGIPVIDSEQVASMTRFIQGHIDRVIADYKQTYPTSIMAALRLLFTCPLISTRIVFSNSAAYGFDSPKVPEGRPCHLPVTGANSLPLICHFPNVLDD